MKLSILSCVLFCVFALPAFARPGDVQPLRLPPGYHHKHDKGHHAPMEMRRGPRLLCTAYGWVLQSAGPPPEDVHYLEFEDDDGAPLPRIKPVGFLDDEGDIEDSPCYQKRHSI